MYSFRKIIMTEHDWEEFKKKVTPLGKKKQLLKKNKEKIILKNLEHKEKFETDFIYIENEVGVGYISGIVS